MAGRSKFTINHVSSSAGALVLTGGSSTGTESFVAGVHVSGTLSLQTFPHEPPVVPMATILYASGSQHSLAFSPSGSNDVDFLIGVAEDGLPVATGQVYVAETAGDSMGVYLSDFTITNSSSHIHIANTSGDKDLLFKVNDSDGGGAGQTALTITGATKKVTAAGALEGASLSDGTATISAGAVTGVTTITTSGNVTVGGNIIADANESKAIFAAVTSNPITIGGGGVVATGGQLKVTDEVIQDASGHARITFDDAGDTKILKNDASSTEYLTVNGANGTINVVGGGSAPIAPFDASGANAAGTDLYITGGKGTGQGAGGAIKLQISNKTGDSDSDLNPALDALTIQDSGTAGVAPKASFAGSVTIAGDLTVNGTTTTIDTDQLHVKDDFIYLGMGNQVLNSDVGILFVSASNFGTRPDVAIGKVNGVNNTFGLGSLDAVSGSVTSLSGMAFDQTFRAAQFEIGSANDSISIDGSSNLNFTVANDAIFSGDIRINSAAKLKLQDADSSAGIHIKAPATVSTECIITLPPAGTGTAGQVLRAASGASTSAVSLEWATVSSGGSMNDFIVAGNTGANQTIENGNTLSVLGGNGIGTVGSATDTLTINLDASLTTVTSMKNDSLVLGRATANSGIIDFANANQVQIGTSDTYAGGLAISDVAEGGILMGLFAHGGGDSYSVASQFGKGETSSGAVVNQMVMRNEAKNFNSSSAVTMALGMADMTLYGGSKVTILIEDAGTGAAANGHRLMIDAIMSWKSDGSDAIAAERRTDSSGGTLDDLFRLELGTSGDNVVFNLKKIGGATVGQTTRVTVHSENFMAQSS